MTAEFLCVAAVEGDKIEKQVFVFEHSYAGRCFVRQYIL